MTIDYKVGQQLILIEDCAYFSKGTKVRFVSDNNNNVITVISPLKKNLCLATKVKPYNSKLAKLKAKLTQKHL